METHRSPSLKNLTSSKFGKPPKKLNPVLQSLGAPHIESFNYFLKHGLPLVIKNLDPIEMQLKNDDKVIINLVEASVQRSEIHQSMVPIRTKSIFPSECRQRGCSYRGRMTGKITWSVNGEEKTPIMISFGDIPIMVKSDLCHLAGMSPAEHIAHGEDADIWGGYFISKGHERLIRMLVQTRSNYPLALKRFSWTGRGPGFSDLGVTIRCVAKDLSATTNVLHFLTDGTAKVMFSFERNLFFMPLVLLLKALMNVTDEFIFQQMMLGMEQDLYYKSCVVRMLRNLHDEKVHSHSEAHSLLGETFRIKFRNLAPWRTDQEVCQYLVRKCVLPHLTDHADKFNLLCLMSRKLFTLAQGKCKSESADAVMMQEAQAGGVIYQQYVCERLQRWMLGLRFAISKRSTNILSSVRSKGYSLSEEEMNTCILRCSPLEGALENFIATGNITTITGMGMMQDKGLTIVAENINRMRYMSHFRALHRGAFFAEMRTTEARQLLPDAWGFICPVHTPDGAPCGLLNHLSRHCHVVTSPCDTTGLPELLASLGMVPLGSGAGLQARGHYFVTLDGRVLGIVAHDRAEALVGKLRVLKAQKDRVPEMLEIVLVPEVEDTPGQFPGIFLFSCISRMMRPVMQLATRCIEMIGTLEQVYLDIAVTPSEIVPGVTTHLEISESTFLSNLASLIPMPDCNQSPRNMYQCQMGKQTMGTPTHTYHLLSETKTYRLQTPASPLFRPTQYDLVELDNNAMGVNAIVAVISYTGYDMEDAMIINKSSYERGFAHGSIYKSELVDIEPNSFFMRDPSKPDLANTLDKDGLPYVSAVIHEGDPIYCFYEQDQCCYKIEKYRGKETVHVDAVKLCGTPILTNKPQATRAVISLRVPRNPTVGDKFASRAGQKGICSQKWPAEDLPFTESGLVPDIVFNPHGFPSRMTIAMMVELMAGKTAAMHGLVHDATPFRFSEDDMAIEYFGKLLQAAGYNHHGTERMYSGVDGREMKADIFVGVCYYQRLRHMVSDKWQVRSTGPVDQVTRQPIKGRRRGGGVRFGEMERDSLISHGASFLLQDRLLHCSDKSTSEVCRRCGSLLSAGVVPSTEQEVWGGQMRSVCRLCGEKGRLEQVELPHVLRLLVIQLASVNIRTRLQIGPSALAKSAAAHTGTLIDLENVPSPSTSTNGKEENNSEQKADSPAGEYLTDSE